MLYIWRCHQQQSQHITIKTFLWNHLKFPTPKKPDILKRFLEITPNTRLTLLQSVHSMTVCARGGLWWSWAWDKWRSLPHSYNSSYPAYWQISTQQLCAGPEKGWRMKQWDPDLALKTFYSYHHCVSGFLVNLLPREPTSCRAPL